MICFWIFLAPPPTFDQPVVRFYKVPENAFDIPEDDDEPDEDDEERELDLGT